jgi:hypothetical protein
MIGGGGQIRSVLARTMPAITVEAEFTNSLTPPGLNLAKP